MSKRNKLIIVTGPCGVGKTSIVTILAEMLEVELIDGDRIRQTLFPEIDYITAYPEKLKIVKETIFERSKTAFLNNKSVLVDYVILGKDYISQYQETFKEDLVFKVLLPKKSVIYQRDQDRACWTSGQEMIDQLYESYINLIDFIGQENYINNEGETPQETVQRILSMGC